jgi:hypothetical protein
VSTCTRVGSRKVDISSAHHFDYGIDNLHAAVQLFVIGGSILALIIGAGEAYADIVVGAFKDALLLAIHLSLQTAKAVHTTAGLPMVNEDDILSASDWRKRIPNNVAQALSQFNLEGQWDTYQLCPRCNARYLVKQVPGTSKQRYKETCDSVPMFPLTDSPDNAMTACGAALTDRLGQPISTALYHPLPDFIAAHVAHPERERWMDEICAKSLGPSPRAAHGFTDDVWGTEFVRTFPGPDSKPFLNPANDEGRVLVEVFMDNFHPEGNKLRSDKKSCKIIVVAMYSLPEGIRYKPENLHVASITMAAAPPTKASQARTELSHSDTREHEGAHSLGLGAQERDADDGIETLENDEDEEDEEEDDVNTAAETEDDENTHAGGDMKAKQRKKRESADDYPQTAKEDHDLEPLVDDLIAGWHAGFFITRTGLRPKGRLYRVAVIASVNDLIAARTSMGFRGPTAKIFCPICDAWAPHVHEKKTWKAAYAHMGADLDPMDIRRLAEQSRDAKSYQERLRIWTTHGVRWAQWWRLPYWDPTRMVIVDPMHAFLEGLADFQTRKALGMGGPAKAKSRVFVPAYQAVFIQPSSIDLENGFWTTKRLKVLNGIYSRWLVRPIYQKLDTAILQDVPGQASDTFISDEQLLKYLGGSVTTKEMLHFILKHLPGLREGSMQGAETKQTKATLASKIVAWVNLTRLPAINSSTTFQRLQLPWIGENTSTEEPFADEKVFNWVRQVNARMSLPSWVEPLPGWLLTATGGTLKAAEQRVLITIVLPIALICLWSPLSPVALDAVTDSQEAVLENTMFLVMAIILALKHRTSEARIQRFSEHYQRYLDTYADLRGKGVYQHAMRPNHHMALHTSRFLRLFGPSRNWWCMPFERLIGHIQKLPKNHHAGESRWVYFFGECSKSVQARKKSRCKNRSWPWESLSDGLHKYTWGP